MHSSILVDMVGHALAPHAVTPQALPAQRGEWKMPTKTSVSVTPGTSADEAHREEPGKSSKQNHPVSLHDRNSFSLELHWCLSRVSLIYGPALNLLQKRRRSVALPSFCRDEHPICQKPHSGLMSSPPMSPPMTYNMISYQAEKFFPQMFPMLSHERIREAWLPETPVMGS